ncbi:putative mating type 1-2 protein [Teratosphaeria destructans]|uniref:Mating type 1-2 protein n=1 Tax=Teratosphaeria destructans TaxID=418781 RepID=A0A9W7W2L2_9PEZI|nr:putative mating type 1-2 protein [Teratosphaeria destructans]
MDAATVSVVMGDKWRAGSDEVREEYKRKAVLAKAYVILRSSHELQDRNRQHELDQPGYQYQSRKPSEQKKRMTKNELAKLSAKVQENNGDGVSVQQLAQWTWPVTESNQG